MNILVIINVSRQHFACSCCFSHTGPSSLNSTHVKPHVAPSLNLTHFTPKKNLFSLSLARTEFSWIGHVENSTIAGIKISVKHILNQAHLFARSETATWFATINFQHFCREFLRQLIMYVDEICFSLIKNRFAWWKWALWLCGFLIVLAKYLC